MDKNELCDRRNYQIQHTGAKRPLSLLRPCSSFYCQTEDHLTGTSTCDELPFASPLLVVKLEQRGIETIEVGRLAT